MKPCNAMAREEECFGRFFLISWDPVPHNIPSFFLFPTSPYGI